MNSFSWFDLGYVMAGGAMGTFLRDAANRLWQRRNRATVSFPHSGSMSTNPPSPRIPSEFPVATLAVNVTGCLMIGVLAGMLVSPESKWFWLAGICGGMTTFSALQWESWNLWRNGRRRMASVSLLMNYGLGLPAAAFGWWLAGL